MRRTPGSARVERHENRKPSQLTLPMPVSFDCTLSSKIFDIPVELRGLYGNVKPITGLEPIRGKLQGVSMGLFQLSSPVCLVSGQDLELLSEARVIQSRVVDCRKSAAGPYNLQMKLSFDACRRAEPRIPADLLARMQVSGDPAAISARVVDLSHTGLGLRTQKAVAAGSLVSVDLGYAVAAGEVRHCAQHMDTYRVGVQIHRFTSTHGALSPVFAASSVGNVSPVALESFVRSVQERQLRYEAILVSLAFRSKSALPAA